MCLGVCEETAPHKLCAYIYEIANEFNKFYHETKILSEEDEEKRSGYIALLGLTKRVLRRALTCLDLKHRRGCNGKMTENCFIKTVIFQSSMQKFFRVSEQKGSR